MKENTNAIKAPFEYEPMRQKRFVVEFDGLDIQSWRIQTVIRDKNKITLKILELIAFKDTIDIVSEHHHKKFNTTIAFLDPTGVTVREYTYIGCLVKKVVLCKLDMSSDDLITTDLEIIFDKCK